MENNATAATLAGRSRLSIFSKFDDPGHGWLRVPLTLLDELGITDKITHYSFKHGQYGYLEEDCDYSTFDKAMKDAGRTYKVEYHHTNRDSHIRNYPRFPARELAFG